jgi:hypothetical protein
VAASTPLPPAVPLAEAAHIVGSGLMAVVEPADGGPSCNR